MTTLVKCAKEMRKCEEISRLDGAKDGGKEMPLLQRGGGGGLVFRFCCSCYLFFGWFLVSIGFYIILFFCALRIAHLRTDNR